MIVLAPAGQVLDDQVRPEIGNSGNRAMRRGLTVSVIRSVARWPAVGNR